MDDINLRRDEETGHLLSPTRVRTLKTVERNEKGRICVVNEERMSADASEDEIREAVRAQAVQLAATQTAMLREAVDKVVEAAVAHADDIADVDKAKVEAEVEEANVEEDKPPAFESAAEMSLTARAEAEERYNRVFANEDVEDLDVEDLEETFTALEYVVSELDHAVRALAKSYGMDDDEVVDDMGEPRKRTTRPRVLDVRDVRPEFRFPDAGEGLAAFDDDADILPGVNGGGRKRPTAKIVKRAGSQFPFGPARWHR
jgi:hypothetical protein